MYCRNLDKKLPIVEEIHSVTAILRMRFQYQRLSNLKYFGSLQWNSWLSITCTIIKAILLPLSCGNRKSIVFASTGFFLAFRHKSLNTSYTVACEPFRFSASPLNENYIFLLSTSVRTLSIGKYKKPNIYIIQKVQSLCSLFTQKCIYLPCKSTLGRVRRSDLVKQSCMKKYFIVTFEEPLLSFKMHSLF